MNSNPVEDNKILDCSKSAIEATLGYLGSRSSEQGPFLTKSGTPVMRSCFDKTLHRCLSICDQIVSVTRGTASEQGLQHQQLRGVYLMLKLELQGDGIQMPSKNILDPTHNALQVSVVQFMNKGTCLDWYFVIYYYISCYLLGLVAKHCLSHY